MAAEGATNAAIEVRNVSRWYGDVVAVNDISFSVGPGITGLLGPNGAGKSTLLHMISGFLRPSAGAVQVLGQPTWRNTEMFRRIGLVPEREAVYPFLGARDFAIASARLHGLAENVAGRDLRNPPDLLDPLRLGALAGARGSEYHEIRRHRRPFQN